MRVYIINEEGLIVSREAPAIARDNDRLSPRSTNCAGSPFHKASSRLPLSPAARVIRGVLAGERCILPG